MKHYKPKKKVVIGFTDPKQLSTTQLKELRKVAITNAARTNKSKDQIQTINKYWNKVINLRKSGQHEKAGQLLKGAEESYLSGLGQTRKRELADGTEKYYIAYDKWTGRKSNYLKEIEKTELKKTKVDDLSTEEEKKFFSTGSIEDLDKIIYDMGTFAAGGEDSYGDYLKIVIDYAKLNGISRTQVYEIFRKNAEEEEQEKWRTDRIIRRIRRKWTK